jgi:transcriptional regulator with XRE-family HTH domain
MSTTTKRVITVQDEANAARLRQVWKDKKRELQLTQQKAAEALGFTQPTFNQYLWAKIPLNVEAIFRFSALLKVSPAEIDPDLNKIKPLFSAKQLKPRPQTFAVLGTTSGKRKMQAATVETEELDTTQQYAGIQIDTDAYKRILSYPTGTLIVLNLTKTPFLEDEPVAVRMLNSEQWKLYKVIRAGKHKVMLHNWLTDRPESVSKSAIAQIYSIQQVIRP